MTGDREMLERIIAIGGDLQALGRMHAARLDMEPAANGQPDSELQAARLALPLARIASYVEREGGTITLVADGGGGWTVDVALGREAEDSPTVSAAYGIGPLGEALQQVARQMGLGDAQDGGSR